MCFGICLQVQSFRNVVGKMESAFMWPGLNKALYCGAGEVAALPKTQWSSQLSMAGKLLYREQGGRGADSSPKSRRKCKFGVNWKDWSMSNYKVKPWSWEFGCCCALVILGWCSFLKICARYLSPWGLKMTHLCSLEDCRGHRVTAAAVREPSTLQENRKCFGGPIYCSRATVLSNSSHICISTLHNRELTTSQC